MLREQNAENHTRIPLRGSVGAFRGNWPWVIIVSSNLFFWIAFIARIAMVPYFFEYVLHRKDLIPLANGLDVVSLGAIFMIPWFCRLTSKRNVWLLALAGSVAAQFVVFLGINAGSVPLVLVGWIAGILTSGVAMAFPFSLISDSVDYGEWKTGVRTAGLLVAVGTSFCLKAGSGLGGASAAWILDISGYVAHAATPHSTIGHTGRVHLVSDGGLCGSYDPRFVLRAHSRNLSPRHPSGTPSPPRPVREAGRSCCAGLVRVRAYLKRPNAHGWYYRTSYLKGMTMNQSKENIPMDRPLGLGILGLGEASRSIISAAKNSPMWKVVQMCDINETLCRERCREFDLTRYTTSFDELLADPAVDVVGIYTPDHLHSQHILRVLEAGKHVICTKPLLNDLSQARALLAAQKRSGKHVFVGQSTRFFAPFIRQREHYETGAFGEMATVEAAYHADHRWFLAKPWARERAFKWLFGCICHPADLVRWYLPDIDEVMGYADLSAHGFRRAGLANPDTFHFVLKSATGKIARVSGAYSGPTVPEARDSGMTCILRCANGASQADYYDLALTPGRWASKRSLSVSTAKTTTTSVFRATRTMPANTRTTLNTSHAAWRQARLRPPTSRRAL